MKEHGVLFQRAMVRAILTGRKSVTRRTSGRWLRVQVGDRLWVRETYALGDTGEIEYRADVAEEERPTVAAEWRPSIFMPRVVARILLDVVNVRQEPWSATDGTLLPMVDEVEASREGFDSRAEFVRAIVAMNGGLGGHLDFGHVSRIEFRRRR